MPSAADSNLRLRRWLGALTGVLLALAAWLRTPGPGPRPIAPETGEVDPFARGSFTEGSFHADAAELPPGIAARGSYIGGDAFRGTFISGWFGRRSQVELMVAGYPNGPDNALGLEVRLRDGGVRRLPYTSANPGEIWKPWLVALPADALGFRIVAIDGSATFRGWLAVSEPYRTGWRLTLLPQAWQSLLAFLVQGVLFTALALALTEFVSRRFNLPAWLMPIGGAAGVAMLGYVGFWLYFTSPVLGRIYSWLILAWAAVRLVGTRSTVGEQGRLAEWREPLFLAGIIGAGAVALTCLFVGGSFSYLAANRFLNSLPVDNQIPQIFAERLWSGQSPKNLLGDWLSSDRPPLQTGWLLLTKPILNNLGFDGDTSAGGGGVCFQLLWVPALWALLRRMGARPRQASAVIAAVSFSGFFLIFTIFTWPKLGAASLVLAAFVAGWTPPTEPGNRRLSQFVFSGACAALGYLAHGGVAFSLIGLFPLVLVAGLRRQQTTKACVEAGIGFGIVVSPWLAYQKFYEPPGNRLLKWHLAGVVPPDNRSFGTTLIASYRALGWHEAWATRHFNLTLQWVGHWRDLASWSPQTFLLHRWEQITYSSYAFGWWLPALLLVPWAAWRERKCSHGIIGWTMAWWLAGWLVWVALMFSPNQTIIHQGTLLTQLLGFALMAWCALRLSRAVFLACAALEIILFLVSWVPASAIVSGAISPLAFWVSIIAGLVLAEIIITGSRNDPAV